MENLYRAAEPLEGELGVRVQLVSTELIDDLGGEWSDAVQYRFKDDPGHPGIVYMELRYVEPPPPRPPITDAELVAECRARGLLLDVD